MTLWEIEDHSTGATALVESFAFDLEPVLTSLGFELLGPYCWGIIRDGREISVMRASQKVYTKSTISAILTRFDELWQARSEMERPGAVNITPAGVPGGERGERDGGQDAHPTNGEAGPCGEAGNWASPQGGEEL